MTQEWIELKDLQAVALAQTNGWEIERRPNDFCMWVAWQGAEWQEDWKFRGRPPQPKMKKVKSICWRGMKEGGLYWTKPDRTFVVGYKRFPAGDIEGEVEDD